PSRYASYVDAGLQAEDYERPVVAQSGHSDVKQSSMTRSGLFNALYMNLIDCSAAMPPIARLYRVLATFSARLKRRMLAANERILAKTPGFLRIREASSAKLPSRT